MTTVHFDSRMQDDERRERLFAGDLFVYSPTPQSLELVQLAREMLATAFGSLDPELAQYHMPVEQYARVLTEFKPKFIHHPACKQTLPRLLAGLGCDPEATYFDVPRIRTSTSDNYLTSGIAYAFHPHRDTWYSAPMCQMNWWLPVFDLTYDNCMAFHPYHWSNQLPNSSNIYNYQEWTKSSRFSAGQQIGVDSRPQPKALDPAQVRQPDIRLLPPAGGLILFSAAQLHSSVPNTSGKTRISIDFRTVHLADVVGLRGAPNVDSRCTGSTMDDYLRCSDLSHLPADAKALYDAGPPPVVAAG
jgi:hypothetical protein